MRKRASLILTALLFFTLSIESDLQRTVAQSRNVPAPADVIGFTPGDDRNTTPSSSPISHAPRFSTAIAKAQCLMNTPAVWVQKA